MYLFNHGNSRSFLTLLICIFLMIDKNMYAQQNLFNVPSSEITTKKGIFFQQQFNVSDMIQSNTNLCYGLGSNMEVGFNFISLQSDYHSIISNEELGKGSISPTSMFTFQKVFKLTEHTNIGAGVEIGFNMFKSQMKNTFFTNFNYLNSHTSLMDNNLHLIGGAYYANKAYQGEESGLGLMMGYEYTLSKKIHLVGDWVSGDNYIGVAAIGGMYYVAPNIPLSFGFQIPNNSMKNSYGFVFEFTYLPKHSKS